MKATELRNKTKTDFNGNNRFIGDEDAVGIDMTIIDGWFTAVPIEPVEEV